ncbi:hypothetical protein FZEAL_6331 [Fusarium zealandicum]|uniref:Uncharacterized protein n=1 Tax=Fusarium zealandicum TaxID=1053134 RepID=A0A8H4XJZ9_9HYPO|nr:hypothetical protein FZEAL_6331 [Fusarium zealandicum]
MELLFGGSTWWELAKGNPGPVRILSALFALSPADPLGQAGQAGQDVRDLWAQVATDSLVRGKPEPNHPRRLLLALIGPSD